ncbi:CLUMA_CG011951, isoform A [Clunio marinus]|uniref:CLUMA_CG011951, isoform A n=1 Tax=Clunio marinus TaxID=568069 RepID=A0A1J1IEP3_9DIPT|nr:CLUMA_CG011951, isoform A [Clunio marinus]
MPESSITLQHKLVPTISVDIHPTIKSVPRKTEIDTLQDEVEEMLGLKITGGVDFQMPLTIFHVKEDSNAKRVGLKLGDSIVSIENKETREMTLKEACETLLHARNNIQSFKLGITRFEDDETLKTVQCVEEVVMEGNPKAPRFLVEPSIEPPREAYKQHPERKAWHPIMWPHPEYFLPEDYHDELPHKRIVRNVRKLLETNPSKVEVENILTALPRGSRPKRNYDDDSD